MTVLENDIIAAYICEVIGGEVKALILVNQELFMRYSEILVHGEVPFPLREFSSNIED